MSIEITNGPHFKTQNERLVHDMKRQSRYEPPSGQDDYDSAQLAIAHVAQAYQGLYPTNLILHLLGDPQTPNEVSLRVRDSLPI